MSMQQAIFERFRRVVYDASGIALGPRKKALLAARVGKRMRALGVTDYGAYLGRVSSDTTGAELTQLVDAVCTNVTGFFREEDHFVFLKEAIAGWIAEGRTRLRFWSAACSTGEEPYTLAMVVEACLVSRRDIDIKILGTDLSTRALAGAAEGAYKPQKLAGLPPALVDRFFVPVQEGDEVRYSVAQSLRDMTVFRQLNLARPPFGIRGPLDAVLCRNVMIYFDKPVREALLQEIARLLRPGGHVIVGHAESLSGLATGLVPVRPSVYVKP
jgi:chemotaxis protein methyltransferase CheR